MRGLTGTVGRVAARGSPRATVCARSLSLWLKALCACAVCAPGAPLERGACTPVHPAYLEPAPAAASD